MRIMLKVDGKWADSEAPASPEDLSSWMWKHDGEDAVVADDEKGIYYCGNEKLLQAYRSKGKTAELFPVLDARLRTS